MFAAASNNADYALSVSNVYIYICAREISIIVSFFWTYKDYCCEKYWLGELNKLSELGPLCLVGPKEIMALPGAVTERKHRKRCDGTR